MASLPAGSVDMVLCDLPYGITDNHWDCVIPFDELWAEYARVCKENAAIVLFGAGKFTQDLIQSKRQWYRYDLIWDKRRPVGFLNANRMPLRRHETICVFYRSLPTYNPQKIPGKPYVKKRHGGTTNYGACKRVASVNKSGLRYPTSILCFSTMAEQKYHPTQKPVKLLEWLIKTYTNENELVLDNCMGSGSTGVACVNTGRYFIGMEQEQTYFAMAQERILL